MLIRHQLFVKIVATAIVTLLSVYVAISTLLAQQRSVDNETLLVNALRTVAQLSSLAHEFALHPAERITEQWRLQQQQLSRLLKRLQQSLPEEHLAIVNLAQRVEHVDSIFSRWQASAQYAFNKSENQTLMLLLQDDLVVESQAMIQLSFDIHKNSIDIIRHHSNTSTFQMLGMLATLVLIIIVLSVSSWHSMIVPLGLILAGTKQLQIGNLAHLIPVHSEDELGEISHALNAMSKQLHYNQHLLESIVDNTSAIIYVKDKNGGYITINHAYEALLNTNRKTIAGKTDHDLFTKQIADVLRANDLQAMQTGKAIAIEETAQHADGVLHHYISIKFPIYDVKSRLLGSAGISTDISERIHIEQQLASKTAELLQSNEALQRFAYVASHDLQEPLRAIYGFAELLQRKYHDKLDAQAMHYIDYITSGATRLQAMIQALLHYSRLETQHIESVAVDLNQAYGWAVDNLQRQIRDTHACIGCVQLPVVKASLQEMGQLFQNLIGNAIKYAKPNLAPKIDISSEYHQGDWHIKVSDNGEGIAEEYWDQIFEIFKRLHGHSHSEGNGIGLAICKKIVEKHGGKLWLSSIPGEGSTFHVLLHAA
ncbi:MAG: PAS domain-containing protein [Gammaproteobacteria bacterium]|nr:PAS domain-containing protein [Gammaproteobacteria bacterium]